MGDQGAWLNSVQSFHPSAGVVSKRLNDHRAALGLFEKLHSIIPNSIEVRPAERTQSS